MSEASSSHLILKACADHPHTKGLLINLLFEAYDIFEIALYGATSVSRSLHHGQPVLRPRWQHAMHLAERGSVLKGDTGLT